MEKYRGKRHYDEKFVQNLASESHSKREMLIGMSLPSGGTYGYRVLNYFLDLYGIDVSHFEGRERAANMASKAAIPLEEILRGEHPHYGCFALKLRMLKEGLFEHRCAECQLSEWRGKPIPLDMDHINGKSWDHRRENLRLLCRNCHAQTDTFCGKNTPQNKRKTAKKEEAESRKAERRMKQEAFIPMVLASGIDFGSSGWVTAVAPLINQAPQKVNGWMKKYMPEFYNSHCWKRKSPASLIAL